MDTPGKLVGRLMADIGAVAGDVQRYVRRPGADFTRTRMMGAGDVIRALVCMGAGTLGHELAAGAGCREEQRPGPPRGPGGRVYRRQRPPLTK